MSDKQIQSIQAIFEKASTPNPAELDTWRLILTCDHAVDKRQHSSHDYWSGSTVSCPTCQQTRGIVSSEKLPPSPARHAAEDRRLTDELQTARDEHEKHQKKADAALRNLTRLEGEIDALGPPRTAK